MNTEQTSKNIFTHVDLVFIFDKEMEETFAVLAEAFETITLGAIIREGQLYRVQMSRAIFLESNYRGAIIQGAITRGTISIIGGNKYHRGNCLGGNNCHCFKVIV